MKLRFDRYINATNLLQNGQNSWNIYILLQRKRLSFAVSCLQKNTKRNCNPMTTRLQLFGVTHHLHCQKRFRIFFFFCVVNQTITIASTVFVKKWQQCTQAEAANVNVGGNIPGLGNFMVIDYGRRNDAKFNESKSLPTSTTNLQFNIFFLHQQ